MEKATELKCKLARERNASLERRGESVQPSFARMSGSRDAPYHRQCNQPCCKHSSAAIVAKQLDTQTRVTRANLNEAMLVNFVATTSKPSSTHHDRFVTAQRALVFKLRGTGSSRRPTRAVENLHRFASMITTQTLSKKEQIKNIRLLTPLRLSWFLTLVAQISPEDTVSETSAGVGLIAQSAGQGKALQLGEILMTLDLPAMPWVGRTDLPQPLTFPQRL